MKKKEKDVVKNNRADVSEVLRNRIVEGIYLPGSKLNEQDLTLEFKISRPLAREILIDLESRGLVEKEPNKGAVVRRIDFNSLIEIMQVRESLEGLAARLAAEKSDPSEWEELSGKFGETIERAVEENDLDTYFNLVSEFQTKMFAAARNNELSRLNDLIFTKMIIVQRRLIVLPGRMRLAMEEHRKVLKAIMDKEPEKAELARRDNLRSALNYYKKYSKWVL